MRRSTPRSGPPWDGPLDPPPRGSMCFGPQVTGSENYPVAPSGELQPTDRAFLLTPLTNLPGTGEGKRRSPLRPENASLSVA